MSVCLPTHQFVGLPACLRDYLYIKSDAAVTQQRGYDGGVGGGSFHVFSDGKVNYLH